MLINWNELDSLKIVRNSASNMKNHFGTGMDFSINISLGVEINYLLFLAIVLPKMSVSDLIS